MAYTVCLFLFDMGYKYKLYSGHFAGLGLVMYAGKEWGKVMAFSEAGPVPASLLTTTPPGKSLLCTEGTNLEWRGFFCKDSFIAAISRSAGYFQLYRGPLYNIGVVTRLRLLSSPQEIGAISFARCDERGSIPGRAYNVHAWFTQYTKYFGVLYDIRI